MNEQQKTIDLSEFGLTQNQSLVYQSGLQLGSRPASAIARQAGLHRVLTFNTLQELCKLGLATCITIKNVGYYTMAEPQHIHEKLQDKAKTFSMLLPQLQSLIKQSGGGFKVQSYQGFEGLKTLYDHVPQSRTDLKAFLGADHIDPLFRDYLYDIYLPKRLAKGLYSRSLVSLTDHNKYFADPVNAPQTEVVIIPDQTFDLSGEIILFDTDKILIASATSTEMSGLLIQSESLFFSLEQIFELLWKIYKPLQKQKSVG